MKHFLIFIILIISGSLYAQETDRKLSKTDISNIEIRTTSREQSVVKRDNFHRRRDMRALQMKKKMRISKQKRNSQNKSLQIQKKKRQKSLTKQKKQQMKKQQIQKQRQRAIRNRAKR